MTSCSASREGEEMRTCSPWMADCTFFNLRSFRNFTILRAVSVSRKDADTKPIDLAGAWKYKVTVPIRPLPKPANPFSNFIPSNLYNAMIYPLAPYPIQGVIWYQGESNAAGLSSMPSFSRR